MRAIIIIGLFFSVVFVALAGDEGDEDSDHDWARDAVLSGQAVPLALIIDSVENTYNAKVYEVALVKSDDASVASLYRLKLVSEDGRLIELLVDTSSGNPVGIGGQGIDNQGTGDGDTRVDGGPDDG